MPDLAETLISGEKRNDAAAAQGTTTTHQPIRGKTEKPKISRWILFKLWFNTYKKFFTFVTLFNLVCIILAATGHFHYAENHLGALVLGNLLFAILMRNELFMRFLYMVAIHGLKVCVHTCFFPPYASSTN